MIPKPKPVLYEEDEESEQASFNSPSEVSSQDIEITTRRPMRQAAKKNIKSMKKIAKKTNIYYDDGSSYGDKTKNKKKV